MDVQGISLPKATCQERSGQLGAAATAPVPRRRQGLLSSPSAGASHLCPHAQRLVPRFLSRSLNSSWRSLRKLLRGLSGSPCPGREETPETFARKMLESDEVAVGEGEGDMSCRYKLILETLRGACSRPERGAAGGGGPPAGRGLGQLQRRAEAELRSCERLPQRVSWARPPRGPPAHVLTEDTLADRPGATGLRPAG